MTKKLAMAEKPGLKPERAHNKIILSPSGAISIILHPWISLTTRKNKQIVWAEKLPHFLSRIFSHTFASNKLFSLQIVIFSNYLHTLNFLIKSFTSFCQYYNLLLKVYKDEYA